MEVYSLYQWLMFFFIYCFIGWIWETGYVSVMQKRFVNRGFLYGPQIPIYGVGAVLLVFFLNPIKEYHLLTYFAGVFVGSGLEVVTGWAMEKIFHVRYWDYSDKPYNFKGYICLTASLFWGFLGYLLVHYIHAPIERLVLGSNQTLILVLAIIFSSGFITDFIFSFISAYSMRKGIDSLQQLKVELEKARGEVEESLKEKYDEIREASLEKRKESAEKRKQQKEALQAQFNKISEEYTKRRESFDKRRNKLKRRYPTAIAKRLRYVYRKNDD